MRPATPPPAAHAGRLTRLLAGRADRPSPVPAVLLAVALATVALACSAEDQAATSGTAPGAPAAESTGDAVDFVAGPEDFVHLDDMTRVRNFFIANPLGRLDEAVAVAESPDGGIYPVGTIIQLVPQEAMVKRRAGFLPEFADWEFFVLQPTPDGTEIVRRGGTEVLNQFGLSCASCHALADVKWDMVCEKDHGCDPLPISDEVFAALRQADPRPRATTGGGA